MKLIAVFCLAFLFACSDSKDPKVDLKSEYDKNQLMLNDNLAKLDSLTGAMQNPDSFSLERFGNTASQKDSLYKVLDSILARQAVLDSLIKAK
jgi:hypothetical protein